MTPPAWSERSSAPGAAATEIIRRSANLEAAAKDKEAKVVKKPTGSGERPKVGVPGLRFFQDIIAELKRVVWPTRQDAMRLSMMVIIASVAVGLALGAVDYIFTVLIDRVLIGGA